MNDHASDTSTLTNLATLLPNSTAKRVIESTFTDFAYPVFISNARGTLLHDHWLKRMFPPISPVKTLIETLVPSSEVDTIADAIVRESRLDRQAIGAIFSTDYQQAYCGAESPVMSVDEATGVGEGGHGLDKNLRVICCIVNHNLSDKVAKAAIDAGAHGPIIYYCEGRGLRDRLGWLRITKEHEKEVLMIFTDEDDADDVFDALATAGELHLPGKGFMYSLPISKGMFNLPSRMSHHHHTASMQQIIHAIDQLSGHTHWRDQAIFDLGSHGTSSGFDFINHRPVYLEDQACLTVLTDRTNQQRVIDLLLDLHAPGLNISFNRHINPSYGAMINDEYVKIQSVMSASLSQQICEEISAGAEANGLKNVFCGVTEVLQVATYTPGNKDYRMPKSAA